MSTLGTCKNAKAVGQEGTKKGKPPYKKATKDIQIKKSHKKGNKAKNAEGGNTDTLLGDLVANTATANSYLCKDLSSFLLLLKARKCSSSGSLLGSYVHQTLFNSI